MHMCVCGMAGGVLFYNSYDPFEQLICVATSSVFSAVSTLAPIYKYMHSTCSTIILNFCIRAYVFHQCCD